jgi:hypothetical protein
MKLIQVTNTTSLLSIGMYSYLVRTINFSVDDVWTFQAGPQREQTQSIPSGLIRSACRYRTGRYKPVGANCTWRLLFTFPEAPGNDSGIGKRCVETVAALTAPVMMTRKREGSEPLPSVFSLHSDSSDVHDATTRGAFFPGSSDSRAAGGGRGARPVMGGAQPATRKEEQATQASAPNLR